MSLDRIIAVIDSVTPHLGWLIPLTAAITLAAWLLWPGDVVPSHICGICGGGVG